MTPQLRFPDAATLKKDLSQHPDLTSDFYKKTGLTEAISEVAANIFANINLPSEWITAYVFLVMKRVSYNPPEELKKLNILPHFWVGVCLNIHEGLLTYADPEPTPKAKL